MKYPEQTLTGSGGRAGACCLKAELNFNTVGSCQDDWVKHPIQHPSFLHFYHREIIILKLMGITIPDGSHLFVNFLFYFAGIAGHESLV